MQRLPCRNLFLPAMNRTTVKQFFCHCKRCISDVVINLGKEVSFFRLILIVWLRLVCARFNLCKILYCDINPFLTRFQELLNSKVNQKRTFSQSGQEQTGWLEKVLLIVALDGWWSHFSQTEIVCYTTVFSASRNAPPHERCALSDVTKNGCVADQTES